MTLDEELTPSAANASMHREPRRGRLKRLADVTLGWMAQQGARSYVAGPEIGDALNLCTARENTSRRFIVCPWDRPGDRAADVQATYRGALTALRRTPELDCYLSIKFPSLGYDPARAEAIVALGDSFGVRVHFDALGPESVDRTLALIEQLRSRYRNIGATISARWQRSTRDIELLLDLGTPIRLVKGQLPDRTGGDVDPRAGFLRLVKSACRATAPIGIATHDQPLAEHALLQLQSASVTCELEQLFRLPPVPFLTQFNVPVRLYIPYGHGYPPYDVYVAIKHPRKGLRLLTDLIRGCVIAHREQIRPKNRLQISAS